MKVRLRLLIGAAAALAAGLIAPAALEREPTIVAAAPTPSLMILAAVRTPAKPAAPRSAAIAASPVFTLDVQLFPSHHAAPRPEPVTTPAPAASAAPAPAIPAAPAPAAAPSASVASAQPAANAPPAISTPTVQLAKAAGEPDRKICLTTPASAASLAPAPGKPLRMTFEPSLTRPARDIAPKAPAPEVERQIRLSTLLADVLEK